jgi:NAD(P)-dependent dehydrogenase (short-subunit alcohol dehydrogenase family)
VYLEKITVRIVLSVSSDIGTALAKEWVGNGEAIVGTYRTWSANCEELLRAGVTLIKCDFTSKKSILKAFRKIPKLEPWTVLVMAAGDQKPIGLFRETSFDEWENSFQANFLGMLRILQSLMKSRKHSENATVIFFAGGGTNNATERYSAYTISKIASIKLCELLDFEEPRIKFIILGPGWVKTKIHQDTLENPRSAGLNFDRTLKMIQSSDMNPMSKVLEFCNWVISQPKEIVSGRNFSVVFDSWGTTELNSALTLNSNLYKLRRYGNDISFPERPIR